MKRPPVLLALLTLSGFNAQAMGEHPPGDYAGPTAESFRPVRQADLLAVNAWTPGGALLAPHNVPESVLLPDGKVLLVGGLDYTTGAFSAECELYQPSTNTWTRTAPLNGPGRWGHTLTLLKNGRVLVTGGSGNSAYISDAELYDPATGTWRMTGRMASARDRHTATLLPDGRVLVVGGNRSSLQPAELYDPATETWSLAGTPSVPRAEHIARLLRDGRVLVAGGGGLTQVELFDPATGTWSLTGSLSTARTAPSAELLPDGKVVLIGGRSAGAATASAELYDPTTGIWTHTRPLGTARQYQRSVSLANGKVLVAGGLSDTGYLSSAEIFDPVSLSFTAAPSMNQGRLNFAMTRLHDGRVLVAGTQGLTTELYQDAALPQGARYDSVLAAPACTGPATSCDTGTGVNGRGTVGPEANAPNTLARSCADASSGIYRSDESLERVRVTTVDDTLLARGKSVRVEASVWAYSGVSSDFLDIFYAPEATAPVWRLIATVSPTAPGAQTLSTTFTLAPTGGRHALRAQFRYMGSAEPCSPGNWNDRDDLVFDVQ